jgi:hypothetical protein
LEETANNICIFGSTDLSKTQRRVPKKLIKYRDIL